MESTLLQSLAIALGLGLLVGIEREWARSSVAGVRTFTLITLFGVLTSELAGTFGAWTVGAGLLSVAAIIVTGNLIHSRQSMQDPGVTSEIAAMMMFSVGVLLGVGSHVTAIVVAGTTAVLLHWKTELHGFVQRIGKKELTASIRFVLIAMVILPLLPNRAIGPYGVLNPFEIWAMVVLIVGISLGSYFAYFFLGSRSGTIVTGMLGGMISSTATTVGYARATRRDPSRAETSAVVIIIASTVVFARVLVEIRIVAPNGFGATAGPLLAVMLWFALVAIFSYVLLRGRLTGPTEHKEPPTNLTTAIVFGLLYAAVLVAVAFAKEHLGDHGLYLVAALSGLTDMDAITLSSAKMMREGVIETGTAWRMILIGAMANLAFKTLVVAALGDRRLLRAAMAMFGVALAGAWGVFFLWRG